MSTAATPASPPVIAPSVETLPPRVLRGKLRPGETPPRLTTHTLRLCGVDRPLDVAALIRSTLTLPFDIEDRTR